MVNITITNQIPSGSGFAVTDQGEGVFCPAHLMAAFSLIIGETYAVLLNENTEELRHKTPWRLVGLAPSPAITPLTPVQPEVMTREEIMRAVLDLLSGGDIYSMRDLADEVIGDHCTSKDPNYVLLSNTVARMHDEGKIAGAAVRQASSQIKASFFLYARSTDDFR